MTPCSQSRLHCWPVHDTCNAVHSVAPLNSNHQVLTVQSASMCDNSSSPGVHHMQGGLSRLSLLQASPGHPGTVLLLLGSSSNRAAGLWAGCYSSSTCVEGIGSGSSSRSHEGSLLEVQAATGAAVACQDTRNSSSRPGKLPVMSWAHRWAAVTAADDDPV